MKINKLFITVIITICMISCVLFSGFCFLKKAPCNDSKIKQEISENTLQNNVWCITFQLVWNEFADYFKLNKIEFEQGNPPLADELNKKLYTKDDISENSYYIAYGEATKKLKNKIEKDLYSKFKEKSDILNIFDWGNKNSYVFYSMLKKEFSFPVKFPILKASEFNSNGEYKYFGISTPSEYKEAKQNVKVLFYNNENDYAVSLNTNEKENVLLLRTDRNDSFEELYSYIQNNIKFDKFNKIDTLKVPFININKTYTYKELCNKRIKGTNLIISQAIQTIKFKMDNKGGTLKSEAGIGVRMTALAPDIEKPRHFNFDKNFVMFLKESNKDKPYFAVKVTEDSYLVRDNK